MKKDKYLKMTNPNPPALTPFEPDLARALNLALAARRAAELGDLARAEQLRAEHDAIYNEIEAFFNAKKLAKQVSNCNLENKG